MSEPAPGNWNLTEAVVALWRKWQLDERFRRYWPDPSDTRWEVLHDTEAPGNAPLTYCVWQQSQVPRLVGRSAGKTSSTEQELWSVDVSFSAYATTSVALQVSGKELARDLVRAIADVYDREPLEMSGGDAFVQTLRSGDWPTKEPGEVWSWTLAYEVQFDRTLTLPRQPD